MTALEADLTRRIADGWTATVQGNCVRVEAPDPPGGLMMIRCGTEAEAQALLDAARAA